MYSSRDLTKRCGQLIIIHLDDLRVTQQQPLKSNRELTAVYFPPKASDRIKTTSA